MRAKSLVLSGLLLVASGQSWGCKVSVGDDDGRFEEETDEPDAGGTRDGGFPTKPPKAGSGSAGSKADGGVAGGSSQAGRSGTGSGSSGTTGNAGTGSSGTVPGSTKLSDLDQGDAMAVCNQFASEIGDIITDEQIAKVNCTLDAFISTYVLDPETNEFIVDVPACEAEAESCIEDGLGESTMECDVSALLSMTANCDATVSEYLACNRGLAEQYGDVSDQLSCATFVDPMAAEDAILALDAAEVPACVTLFGKCPELDTDG